MASPVDPIRPTDADARALARSLIDDARFAALGVIEPASGAPMVTRVAIARDARGLPMTLVSDLSQHTKALRSNPACSLLLGEPGPRGDPLMHPRLTLQCRAVFVAPAGTEHGALRARYLAQHPKAKLYIDFGDFRLIRFDVHSGFLNGGFGKAFNLTAKDLTGAS
ncbi:MAG: pyridoxamine 5'-phosphate oxidase family protein [Rhodobacter sp.]|nr:pyridoxamine 5'-phosphate oxidase family protein [Rhodobacter sp.]